jgi:hypothetical protein
MTFTQMSESLSNGGGTFILVDGPVNVDMYVQDVPLELQM